MPVPEISPPNSPRLAGVPTERTLVNRDCRFAAVVAQDNADDIEAAGRRPVAGQPAKILPSDGANMFLLVPVDGSRRRGEISAGPGLDFDEAKNTAIPADQVDLAAVIGDAEISRYNPIAEGSQVEIRLNFTLLAGPQVLWFWRSKTFTSDLQTSNANLVSHITGKRTGVRDPKLEISHGRNGCDDGHGSECEGGRRIQTVARLPVRHKPVRINPGTGRENCLQFRPITWGDAAN